MGGHFGAKGSSLNDRGAGDPKRRFNYASERSRSGTWSHHRHTESCKPNKTKQKNHPKRKIKLLSYVDDLLVKASQASSDWFYEKLFARFECKPAQWLSCKTPLDHLGMTIFQDGEGTYISMEDYIRAMLVKLQMTDCASGRRI